MNSSGGSTTRSALLHRSAALTATLLLALAAGCGGGMMETGTGGGSATSDDYPVHDGEADVRVHEEAGIEITVPAGWVTDSGDDMLTIADAGDEVAITFMIMDTDDLTAALDALDSELSEFVDDLKPESDAMETDVNGMEAMFMDATGSVEGAEVDIGIFIILTPTGKAMLMFGIIAADADPALEGDVDDIMRSIRPL